MDRWKPEQPGARRLEVTVAGVKGFVVLPAEGAGDGSKPWVWYAPARPGYPNVSNAWVLDQLLPHGFAVAGIDVGELWGNDEAIAKYNAFYESVVSSHGLDAKACLLAQSRGGPMHYNWASENVGRVQCIAGIYPICDLFSRSDAFCGIAGVSEPEFLAFARKHNPIDRLGALARAKVPILHVHGDSDDLVPLKSNSLELARRYEALGGKVQVVVIAGKGHEECVEIHRRRELVDFLLGKGRLPRRGPDGHGRAEGKP
jgi:pimeloyl-ACP methyl ester carboxylesterase